MNRFAAFLIVCGSSFGAFAPVSAQEVADHSLPNDDASGLVVSVTGVAVYDATELVVAASDRLRRSAGPATLTMIANAIESIYREDGYVLAEAAVVQDQTGRQFILVDEGSVASLSFNNLSPKLTRRLAKILAPVVGEKPLRRSTLERGLALASDLAGVQAHAHATPQAEGGTTLNVDAVVQTQAGVAGIELIPSRPGYAVRGFVSQELYGSAIVGDLLRVTALVSRDARQSPSAAALVTYRAPISPAGTYVEVYGGNVLGRRTFRDDRSTYRLRGVSAGALIGLVARRDLHNFGYVVAEAEYQRARSRVASVRTESETLSARLHWIAGHDYQRGGILRWGVTASAGVRPDADLPTFTDGPKNFAHLRGEFGMVRVISSDSNATVRIDARAQVARTTLPEVERFAIGHAPFLRGYAPGEVEGDSGVSGTVEFSRTFESARSGRIRSIAPFAFLSGGAAWLDHPRPALGESKTRRLASVGVGADFRSALWQLSGWVSMPLSDGLRTNAGDPAAYLSITRGW